MKKLMAFVLTATTLTIGSVAFGRDRLGFSSPRYETRSIGGSLTVYDSETRSIYLRESRYVRNIVIQAEGVHRDSTVEVMVNGVIKGTVYAPGRDPSYVVTIEEVTSSIEFRHRSGGAMRILDVRATLADWAGPARPPVGRQYFGRGAEAQSIASTAVHLVELLSRQTSLENERVFLLPIKQKAGQVLVMSTARGDIASRTGEALLALKLQIDFAKSYLETQSQEEDSFYYVVELLTLSEVIDDALN